MAEMVKYELPEAGPGKQKREEIQPPAPINNQSTLQYWSNLIIEGIEEAFFSLDKEWHFTYLSNQAVALLGKSRTLLLGKVFWEEFPQSVNGNFGRLYRQAMEDGKPNRLEDFSVILQGWYDVRVYPIEQGLIVYFQDITARKKLEQALQESEYRFKFLSDATFEGVIAHQNGVIVEANQSAAQIYNYASPQDLIGTKISQLINPQNLEDVQRHITENFDKAYETVVVRKDGTSLPAEVRGKTLPYRGETVRVGTIRDISERKRQEQQLRESESRFKMLSEATFEGVVIHHDGVVIEANQHAADMLGYARPEELIGQTIAQHMTAPTLAELQKRIAGGSEQAYEGIAIRKDGQHFPVEVRGRSTEYKGQSVRVEVLKDITERKRAEEVLRKTQSQLLQSQKMESIGRLAGGVAHDFNNLLTAISGYSELILLGLKEDEPLYSDVMEIQKAVNRAASLTGQLLAFSRQQVLQPKVLNLNKAVVEMDKLLHRLIGEDIELLSLPDPRLGVVLADPGQLEQIILNLAVNARHAMPNGGKLTIETANVELGEEYQIVGHSQVKTGSYIMLAVSDTGIGMDKATQEKIFEPFFTTKEIGKGTGLGLATVYGIVEQSGGYIWVYSEVGVGTTFKIYLPRVATALSQEMAKSESRPAGTILEAEVKEYNLAIGQGRTVLVVEDERMVSDLIHRVLAGVGYKILEAHNGQEALELIASEDPERIDLVLTDIVMPQMGGQELVNRLKERWPSMKVLCMSGYADRAVAQHKILEQYDFFLQKPFTPGVLLERIEELLCTAPDTNTPV